MLEAWASTKSFRLRDGQDNNHDGLGRGLQPDPPVQAVGSPGKSVLGRWLIVRTSNHTEDYPDMMEPAHIPFESPGSGEFAFGCVTGQIDGGGDTDGVALSWSGNDEMDEARAMDGPKSSPMAPSKAKPASTMAMTPTSSIPA